MKMKKLTYLLVLGSAFLFTTTGCKREEFNPNFELPRQFKPGEINITAGETQAEIEWAPSLFTANKSETYTIQLSKDSSFQGTILQEKQVDTTYVVYTDDVLDVMEYYFVRVKANALGSTAASGWVHSGRFRITGEQIFLPLLDVDIKDKSVLLKWRPSPLVTKIIITPAGGAPTEITLTPADVAANERLVTGLTPSTNYTAQIYRNTILKGTIAFTTDELNLFTVTLQPGDDLVEAVENAADGDVIGLAPGSYDCVDALGAYVNLVVSAKTITIASTSGNPANTKVNFKEIKLNGTGAGIRLKGIEFDGTAASADYFINLTGLTSDSEAATFTDVIVENCIVHNTDNAFMRGNRGGNNAHKIDSIYVNNTIAHTNGTGSYHYFMIDKLEFKHLEISNSTMYDIARAFISWATNITMPAVPTIVVNQSTINNFGFSDRNNILLDANANTVNARYTNNIIANTPKPGAAVGSSAMRAGNVSTILFNNNNYFNLNGGNPLGPLVFPAYVQMTSNQTIDLGWTATTTDFTLPAASPLRTASETGGPVGDPRWAQ